MLLMYVMSVETSTSLLFCPTLNVKNCPEVERVSSIGRSVGEREGRLAVLYRSGSLMVVCNATMAGTFHWPFLP